MLDFSYIALIKKLFLRNLWAKLLPVYCFTGFIITHVAHSAWMEEEIYRGTSGFAVTASVIPPVLLLTGYILQQYKNANLLLRMGRAAFTRKCIIHVAAVVTVFTIYYMAGVYLISAIFFTDGSWKSGFRGIVFWSIDCVLLLLFVCIAALLFILFTLKLEQTAPGVLLVLIASYVFWRTYEFSGTKLPGLLLLAGCLIIVAKIFTFYIQNSDCRNWR